MCLHTAVTSLCTNKGNYHIKLSNKPIHLKASAPPFCSFRTFSTRRVIKKVAAYLTQHLAPTTNEKKTHSGRKQLPPSNGNTPSITRRSLPRVHFPPPSRSVAAQNGGIRTERSNFPRVDTQRSEVGSGRTPGSHRAPVEVGVCHGDVKFRKLSRHQRAMGVGWQEKYTPSRGFNLERKCKSSWFGSGGRGRAYSVVDCLSS